MANSNTTKVKGPGPMESTGSGPKGPDLKSGGSCVDGAHSKQENTKSPSGEKSSLKKDGYETEK